MAEVVVVKAIIYDGAGRILLQHRDNIPNIIEPNCWGFFGGGVEDGEDLLEALERELREELSCDVGKIEEELFRWAQSNTGFLHVCFAVRFTAANEDLILKEGQALAWYTASELMDLNLNLCSLVRIGLPCITSVIKEKVSQHGLDGGQFNYC